MLHDFGHNFNLKCKPLLHKSVEHLFSLSTHVDCVVVDSEDVDSVVDTVEIEDVGGS